MFRESSTVLHARFLQKEIERLREILRPFSDSDPNTRSLLASYDAELTRVCAIPGVAGALYGEVTPT